MEESRHHIKSRMLKTASRAWGYPETEAENNFDPLVSMLLASCSTELGKISGEIHASRARILERLVQLLSPDVLTGALPSHGIACALPVEHYTTLTPDTQMYVNMKLASASDSGAAISKDLFFSPTASFRLNKASIRFMATGNQLYKVNQAIGKEIIMLSDTGKELPPSTLWLAIDEPGVSLHESLFHFDLRNEADKNLFFYQLPKASWFLENDLLNHLPGYGRHEISGEHLDLEGILNNHCNIDSKTKNHINAYYKKNFLTLLDEDGITAKIKGSYNLPVVISDNFSNKELQLLQKQPLRWIAIKFPETISNRVLKDVVCTMNCFPVMNSRLHEISYRLQEMINIVPLQTEDLFFDLAEVSDDEGKLLNIRPVANAEDDSFAMLMRNGGVGRFDERDAASIIDYILQLLRDESAAFSILGNDFMNSEMKQLQQIINKLEQRLNSRRVSHESIPYLVIRNNHKRPWHNLFIRYRSTNGSEANNIKAGTFLQLYRGGSLEKNQVVLVTTTQGGRNKLGTTGTVLAYKSALLSKDRLISTEDIKAFCHFQLGECVKHIEVLKGVMIQPGQQQGFVKTIDVVIGINRKIYNEMAENGEISFWINNLKLLLEEKSVALMPYRIYINEAA